MKSCITVPIEMFHYVKKKNFPTKMQLTTTTLKLNTTYLCNNILVVINATSNIIIILTIVNISILKTCVTVKKNDNLIFLFFQIHKEFTVQKQDKHNE